MGRRLAIAVGRGPLDAPAASYDGSSDAGTRDGALSADASDAGSCNGWTFCDSFDDRPTQALVAGWSSTSVTGLGQIGIDTSDYETSAPGSALITLPLRLGGPDDGAFLVRTFPLRPTLTAVLDLDMKVEIDLKMLSDYATALGLVAGKFAFPASRRPGFESRSRKPRRLGKGVHEVLGRSRGRRRDDFVLYRATRAHVDGGHAVGHLTDEGPAPIAIDVQPHRGAQVPG